MGGKWSLGQWARTQRIRTIAELPVSADIVPDETYRKYEALAAKVRRLVDLGMTQAEVAKALETTPRTVRRALRPPP